MVITDPEIEKYIESHTSKGSIVLDKIERNTYLKSIYPRMLSGNIQGRFLSMISNMIGPKFILEIGTFTGYSAVCLSEGLQEGGMLHTVEINEELRDQNQVFFKEAGISDKVSAHFGNALDVIPKIDIQFDLIFIDADKLNYCGYFDLAMDNLKKGGFILADNVLWSGKVIDDDTGKKNKDTIAVIKFNEQVQNDDRVVNVMIPLRDGLSLIQKIC